MYALKYASQINGTFAIRHLVKSHCKPTNQYYLAFNCRPKVSHFRLLGYLALLKTVKSVTMENLYPTKKNNNNNKTARYP